MRLETLDTSMRREQTKAEAVARLMASFASHLQAATTDTVREKEVHAEQAPSLRHQQTDRQPSSFFADLQPHHDPITVQPQAADPVRPTDTEQRPAASASATADVSTNEFPTAVEPLQPQAAGVSSAPAVALPPAATGQRAASAASNVSAPSSGPATKPASSSAQGTHTANSASDAGMGAEAPQQKAAPSASEPAAGDKTADAQAPAASVNAQAPDDAAAARPIADAKGVDESPASAEHVAVAAKGMKSVAQHAAHDDDVTEAPAPATSTPATAADTTARVVNPDAAAATARAATAAATPAEAAPVAPLASAAPTNAMAMGTRPRVGANPPAEAEAAADAKPTPASAKAGAADAGALDGADAIIRPQADGGLLVTLAPSANGPVQVRLDVASGSVSNLVFIAPYLQTRNHLEALRPALAAATKGVSSMRILSSSRSEATAPQEGRSELPGETNARPHVDVKI